MIGSVLHGDSWSAGSLTDDRCLADGCQTAGGVRCNYVDRRSRPCFTSWCSWHWEIAFGKPYCRRHANLVNALAGLPASGGWPDIDNRAASLTGWMGWELDVMVAELFSRVAPSVGSWMVNEPVRLVLAPGGGERRWQRAWKLIDDINVLNQVTIEVNERDDTDVLARVDTDLIGHGVPPWIEQRRHGWDDLSLDECSARRREYLANVARSIEVVVTRQELVLR